MDALDRINTRRLMAIISTDLAGLDVDFTSDPTAESIRGPMVSYLSALTDRGALSDFSVGDLETHWAGWVELYPNLKDRIFAWVGARIFRVRRGSSTQHWYHTVLPFSISYDAVDPDDSNPSKGFYWASLNVPHEVTFVSLKVSPVTPVETINLTVTLYRSGVDFKDNINEQS